MIEKIKTLLNDINEDNISEVYDLLNNTTYWIDLFNMYFNDFDNYIIIRNKIISLSKLYDNYNNTYMKQYIWLLIGTFWIIDNLLLNIDDKKALDIEFLKYKNYLINILLDETTYDIVKIKLLYIYYWNIHDSEIEKILSSLNINEVSLFSILLFLNTDNKILLDYAILNYNNIIKLYNTEWFNDLENKWIIKNLYLSKCSTLNNWWFELFIKNNLSNINLNENISIYKDDFLFIINTLISNIPTKQKKDYLKDIEWFNTIKYNELIFNKFNPNNIDLSNSDIWLFYNNWIYIKINNIKIEWLNFKSDKIALDFIKLNITDFSYLTPYYINLLIYHYLLTNEDYIFKILTNNKDYIISNIDLDYILDNELNEKEIIKLDLLLNNISDIFKSINIIDIFKLFLNKYNYFSLHLLELMSIDELITILKYNKDNNNEKVILLEIKKKIADNNFIDLFIDNLLYENKFDEKYIFSYSEVINFLRKNNENDINVIENILNNSILFYKYEDWKILLFLQFLLNNTLEFDNKLQIISTFINNKDKLKNNKYLNILVSDLVFNNNKYNATSFMKWFMEKNLLDLEYINREINKEKSLFYKITSLFKTKKNSDILIEAQKNKSIIEWVKDNNYELLNKQLLDINNMILFISNYKEYLDIELYNDNINQLNEILKKIEILIWQKKEN